MSLLFYQIGIKILSTSLKTIAFLGHEKAKKSVLGKKYWLKDLSKFNSQKKNYLDTCSFPWRGYYGYSFNEGDFSA